MTTENLPIGTGMSCGPEAQPGRQQLLQSPGVVAVLTSTESFKNGIADNRTDALGLIVRLVREAVPLDSASLPTWRLVVGKQHFDSSPDSAASSQIMHCSVPPEPTAKVARPYTTTIKLPIICVVEPSRGGPCVAYGLENRSSDPIWKNAINSAE